MTWAGAVVPAGATGAGGMLKVTPALAQSPLAASTVVATSAASQAAETHLVSSAMNGSDLQMQAMSSPVHPGTLVIPDETQVEAQVGIPAS